MNRASPLLAIGLLAACSGRQSPLAPAGDQAGTLHQLLLLALVVCGIVYLVVIAALVWSLMRRSGDENRDGAERRLNRGLWATGAGIVLGVTILIVGSFLADRALFATRGEDALEVRITGHQWWWRIEYRAGGTARWIETANELHLPRGRTTRVLLGSADVIHSFWVPNVAGKIDMIPGRRNVLDLTPRQSGWFRGQCGEYCGMQHAHMAFDVKVEEPAQFETWLTRQARAASRVSDSRGLRGQAVFARACSACHAVRGTTASGRAGPDLTHVGARRSIAAGTITMSRGALQGWIAQPQALKPGTSMPAIPLAPADADAVAHYLAGLR